MDIELQLISEGQEEANFGRSRLEKLSGENGWRFILGLTLYPFIIVGCPVFLIFDGEGPLKSKRRKERSEETDFWKRTPIPKGTIPWLRFVWTNERYLLTASSLHNYLYWIGLAVTSILTLVMNGLLWGEIGEILYYLLYLGELAEEEIISSAHYVISLLPTVILIDYVWLFGYQLKATVESFDASVILEEVDDFHASGSNLPVCKLKPGSTAGIVRERSREEEEAVNDADLLENGSGALPLLEASDSLSKNLLNPSGMLLGFVYIIVFIIHVSRSILIGLEKQFNVTISEREIMEEDAELFNFAAIVSYTLGCPVYCCFCWGIYYQTASLIRYMDNMNLAGVRMSETHLCAIKQAFKIIARNVTHLNYLFRIYLPALSLAFTGTVMACGYHFASFVTNRVWNEINEIWNSTSEESESPDDSSEDEKLLTADWVRYGTVQVVNLGLNVGLVVLTLYQAKLVNFYIRYIHVKLNDFATGSYPHSNPCSQSVYQTFLLVKTYIHSRLEPGQRRLALMVTPGLATFIPFMKKYTTEKDVSIRH